MLALLFYVSVPLRIQGLVAAANHVRTQLSLGIPADEVETFRGFVRETIATVDQICAQSRSSPARLPTPSRNAYRFLKSLDLKQLPTRAADAPATSGKTLSLRNLKTPSRVIHQRIITLALHPSDTELAALRIHLEKEVQAIERVCTKHNLTPAHLQGQGRTFYAWLAYLLTEHTLETHLQTVGTLMQALHPLAQQSLGCNGDPKMLVQLEIGPLKALYRLRKNKTHLEVQVSQGFMGAEPELLGALAADMVLGKQPQRSQQIRAYSTSEDYTEIELAMELMVEELIDAAKGHTYNLTQLFDQLNHTYFQGGLTQPRLYWSTVATRRKFGHYQPSGDRVMISQTLDSPKVPEWVVEFVLYHELLHKHHGETWSNGRRLVHTPAFRQDEKRYHAYAKAQAWLNKLAH